QSLKTLPQSLPFPLLGLDSDNGSEFINEWLRDWCETNAVQFTRGRPYHKNDNCFVEQKTTPVSANTPMENISCLRCILRRQPEFAYSKLRKIKTAYAVLKASASALATRKRLKRN
ncbi:MAG: transposase family protein, partial [Spirochaetaceae bacterium]|nr:transposase family protein [Spirochaetaceae bacterium]